MLVLAVGWIMSLLVVGSYFWAIRTDNFRRFHWGTLLCCVPLGVVNLLVGASFGMFLNLFFGAVALYGLLKKTPEPPVSSPELPPGSLFVMTPEIWEQLTDVPAHKPDVFRPDYGMDLFGTFPVSVTRYAPKDALTIVNVNQS